MKNISLVFVMIVLIITVSCRSTKKLQTAINKKDTALVIHNTPVTMDSLKIGRKDIDNLQKNYIDFKTFSAKIKVQYEDSKGKQPDVVAFIKMYKDSVIWVSINATFLSIEAFRILITKNNITILNKLEKQVEVHPLSYLESVSKIPLDFKTLQDLIIGNPIYVGDKIVAYKQTENHILLSTVGDFFKNLLTISANTNLIERSKLDDIDVNQNRTGDLTYSEYVNTDHGFFSTYREISVAEKTKVDIILNFKQNDFNKDLTFPFSIPKNYKAK
ncbi:MAG: DUF4292 domain-containing protein [Chitinophagaceae bacterium]|nr:DUF4292 domain-containing protein [Chitinophagaceae bacterium]